MTDHTVGTREEWLTARLKLLEAEKEHTRSGDELARQRQDLPWVRLDKEYQFETDEGHASLADLFCRRSQLLVYHFMFGPDFTGGCLSCSAIADGFNGFAIHLAHHDVMLWAVSRAPIEKLRAYKERMGWSFPWASSRDSDFNFDFEVSLIEEQQRTGGAEYNFRDLPPQQPEQAPTEGPVADWAATTGTDWPTYTRERPGMSAFALEAGVGTTRTPRTRAGSMRCGACISGSTERRSVEMRQGTRTAPSSSTDATTSTRRIEVGFHVLPCRFIAATSPSSRPPFALS